MSQTTGSHPVLVAEDVIEKISGLRLACERLSAKEGMNKDGNGMDCNNCRIRRRSCWFCVGSYHRKDVMWMADAKEYNAGFLAGYTKAMSETPKAVELTNDTFGEWLKEVKEQNGYTYEYMAQKTGMSKFALQRYITRHLPPSLDSVERIVKAFGKHIQIV